MGFTHAEVVEDRRARPRAHPITRRKYGLCPESACRPALAILPGYVAAVTMTHRILSARTSTTMSPPSRWGRRLRGVSGDAAAGRGPPAQPGRRITQAGPVRRQPEITAPGGSDRATVARG
ncbi:hypothetical protein GCM10010285_01260 [Streptomyces pseudogriseolus]|uniref:Uncharacterized protein n=1 Tax=Streptomyces pseudogriseolus TaxID=36817 RepID=A0ABQ2SFH9_STREZ|nr:hypothetical protein GCM10010285_01260 [Streptomyces rubiginosus]